MKYKIIPRTAPKTQKTNSPSSSPLWRKERVLNNSLFCLAKIGGRVTVEKA